MVPAPRDRLERTCCHTFTLPLLLGIALTTPGIPALGQELVRNGSFEEYRRCPVPFTDRSIKRLPHVRSVKGAPAHFHACGDLAGVPSNWAGHQAPWDGQGYAGLVLTAHGGGECAVREFIQLELAAPLVNGGKYQISFQVSLADLSGYMTDRIGAAFTTKDRSGRRGVRDLIGNPDLENAMDRFISDSAGWMTVEGIYNAIGGERYVVIGNFQPCDRTSRKAVTSNQGDGVLRNAQRKLAMDIDPDQQRGLRQRLLATQAYVYLDGVSLRPIEGGEGPTFLRQDAACAMPGNRPPDTAELIPDPGFDHNRPAYRAAWKNASGGTPDFFEGHAGIYLFSAVNRDHREFIRTELLEPLDPCGLYAFRMRIIRDVSYGHAVDRIGVALVDTFVMDRRRGPLPFPPSWSSPHGLVMDNTGAWMTLCGTFQAPGCSRTLIIGNFENDDGTTVYRTDPKAGPFAYYLLDDVSLRRSGTVEGCTLTCPEVGLASEAAMAEEDAPMPWPMVLHFDVADHVPGGELRNLAEELLQALAMDPRLQITIEGHTDTQGGEALNMRLAERRARAVRDGLLRLGVPRANLHLQAHGSSRPVADNSTAEGRLLNRRVEVRVEQPTR
jgi:hypothetical protein